MFRPGFRDPVRVLVSFLLAFSCCGAFFGLSACSDESSESQQAVQEPSSSSASKGVAASAAASKAAASSAETDDRSESKASGVTSNADVSKSKESPSASKSGSATYEAHKWSYEKYPLYYKVWGKAKVSDQMKKGSATFEGRDAKERTGRVAAKVTYKMVEASAGWREKMDSDCDDISGWGHQAKVSVGLSNGRTYNGYAWNRSHLLADSLGGHADPDNLVTGTRTQNVGNNTQSNPGGMQYTETMALNYLRSHHGGWVYYSATPVFKGPELVCRSVYVDIKSDDGSIDQHVEVFNAMRGCVIDYKTGEISGKSVSSAKSSSSHSYSSKRSNASASSSSGSASHASRTTSSQKDSSVTVYVTNSGSKYHAKGCRYLRSQRAMSLSKAISLGYEPCSVCMG